MACLYSTGIHVRQYSERFFILSKNKHSAKDNDDGCNEPPIGKRNCTVCEKTEQRGHPTKESLEKWKLQWCEKILRCATLWMKDFKKGYDSHNVFSWSRWNFAPFPSYNSCSSSLICFPSRPYLWRMDPQLKDGNRAYHRIIWLLEECQASPLYSLSPLPPV